MCGPWPPLPIALYISIFLELTSPILPRSKSLIIICWLQIICVVYAGGACEAWEAVGSSLYFNHNAINQFMQSIVCIPSVHIDAHTSPMHPGTVVI